MNENIINVDHPVNMTEDDKNVLTKEQIKLIKQGIRPDGMDFEQFKLLRNFNKKIERQHLKGVLAFKSINYEQKKLGIKGLTYKK